MTHSRFEVSELACKLREGSLAIFPTDTLTALGACPKYAKKIWEIKKRPLTKPLILMGGCLDDLFEFVQPSAVEDGLKMAKNYWPGPLTIILPTIGSFSNYMNQDSSMLGLRVPDSQLTRELLLRTGPLATTSANISGQEPVNDAIEASIQFPHVPLLKPIPWPKPSGMASTIISWNNGNWSLLRTGSVVPIDI